MEHNHDLEWAELISLYKLVRYDDGPETFESLLEMIRTACDGAFDVVFAPHIKAPGPHIMQHKWLPWDELFDIMKLSGKNFIIDLPQEVNWVGYRFRRDTSPAVKKRRKTQLRLTTAMAATTPTTSALPPASTARASPPA